MDAGPNVHSKERERRGKGSSPSQPSLSSRFLSRVSGPQTRGTDRAGSAPRIEAVPEDISIEAGKVLTVACAFSGDAAHMEWSRGGRKIQLSPGGRFHIETGEDLTTLIIAGVREEDAGTYILKLSNELGCDTATVHISVRSV